MNLNRRPGRAQGILRVYPRLRKIIMAVSVLLVVGLVVVIAVKIFPSDVAATGGKKTSASISVFQQNVGQEWKERKFSPLSWFRTDAIDQPVLIKLVDGREFMQFPGKKPQLINKDGTLGPEGGLGDEIPGLRIFVKSGNKKEAKLEISVWPKR